MSVEAMAGVISKFTGSKIGKKQIFEATRELLDAQGFNGKPTKVTAAELAAMDKADPKGAVARTGTDKAIKSFQAGDTHVMVKGSDEHGEGTYFASGANGAKAQRHVEDNYGNDKGSVLQRGHIARTPDDWTERQVKAIADFANSVFSHEERPNAERFAQRMADLDQHGPKRKAEIIAHAQRIVEATKKAGVKSDYINGMEWDNVFNDPANIAIMSGIKSYHVSAPWFDYKEQKGIDYHVVLDRSIVSVAD
jgi:hypothetical protein